MKIDTSRTIIITGLLAAVLCFFAFDLQRYTTLEYIQEQQATLQAYYQQNQLLVLVGFMLLYILITALSLPAAALFTLLAGALFGFPLGLLVASFASAIGATLAFLIARFVAREHVQAKYSTQLAKINAGFEREGAFYLFAIRLTPVFPFFMINILMALLPIKARTFYWVSQLGMLPGTMVYVWAGRQLSQIQSVADIASPTLLLAFTLLGLFPLLAKKLLGFVRKEKTDE